MKLIRISTELELSVHEFPEGNYTRQNEALQMLIGNNCRMYERVMPERLYTELYMTARLAETPGQCVCMLVDEEGLLKENEPNLLGCYLYKTDQHGHPIMGNILFVGEEWDSDGIHFCGIEDSVFEVLKQKLEKMIWVYEGKRKEKRYENTSNR